MIVRRRVCRSTPRHVPPRTRIAGNSPAATPPLPRTAPRRSAFPRPFRYSTGVATAYAPPPRLLVQAKHDACGEAARPGLSWRPVGTGAARRSRWRSRTKRHGEAPVEPADVRNDLARLVHRRRLPSSAGQPPAASAARLHLPRLPCGVGYAGAAGSGASPVPPGDSLVRSFQPTPTWSRLLFRACQGWLEPQLRAAFRTVQRCSAEFIGNRCHRSSAKTFLMHCARRRVLLPLPRLPCDAYLGDTGFTVV